MLIAVVVSYFVTSDSNEFEATEGETLTEKFGNVRDAFSSAAADDPNAPRSSELGDFATERAAVTKSLQELARAHGAGRGTAFGEGFHVARMMADIPALRKLRGIQLRKEERGLKKGIQELARSEGRASGRWGDVEVRRITFHASRPEALVYCRVELPKRQVRTKMRFWMIKDDGWKAYDWEYLEGSMRLTSQITMAIAAQRNRGDFFALKQAWAAIEKAYQMTERGEPEEAIRVLGGVDERGLPDSARATLRRVEAEAFLAAGEYDKSVRSAEEALRIDADLPASHLARALSLVNLERSEEARAAARKYLELLGDDEDGWYVVGMAEEQMGNTAEARAAYEAGMKADLSHDVDNRTALANLLVESEPERAIELFLEAARLGGKNVELYVGICQRLLEAGRPGELDQIAKAFATDHPADAFPWFYQGAAAHLTGRLRDAERLVSKARGIVGEDYTHFAVDTELAVITHRIGKKDEAAEIIDNLGVFVGGLGSHHMARALVQAADGDHQAALQSLDRALAYDPDLAWRADHDPLFEQTRALAKFESLDRSGRWSERSLPAVSSQSLPEARKGFSTVSTNVGDPERGPPPPQPPKGVFELTSFTSSAGTLAAYVTPDPGDGKRHPAVVWCHAGRAGIGRELWRDQEHVGAFTGSGVIVFCPSWRGENANPGRRELFYGEVDDALAAVRHVRKLPYVDPGRVYMAGHAEGGTIALLAALSDDELRAAFSIGGLVDLWGRVDGLEAPFDPRDRKEAYLRSARHFVTSLRVPTFWFDSGLAGDHIQDAMAMRDVAVESRSPFSAFLIDEGTPEDIVGPMTSFIALKIKKDRRHSCNIKFTSSSVNEANDVWFAELERMGDERAKQIDEGMLAKLADASVDLGKPLKLRYRFQSDHLAPLEAFVAAVKQQGLEVDVIQKDEDEDGTPINWCHVVVTAVPDERSLNVRSIGFARLARQHDVRYTGWGTTVRQ